MSEELLKGLADRGLPVIIFRPGIVVGCGTPASHWGVGKWASDTSVTFWGKGTNGLPFVIVEDVADAMVAVLDREDLAGESFNLVTNSGLSARDYAAAIEAETRIGLVTRPVSIAHYFAGDVIKNLVKYAIGHHKKRRPSYRDWASRSQRASYSYAKAKAMFGWKPAETRDEILGTGCSADGEELLQISDVGQGLSGQSEYGRLGFIPDYRTKMKVSICILEKDEASKISETLERLFDHQYTCMPTPQIEKIDVSCVANGCTDNTASIAGVDLASRRNSHPNKTFTVHELEMPGKSNAWNYYVHQVSASDTDFYVFMDADVIFPKTDALTKLLNTLIDAPEAFVSVGLPLKDISRKSRQSLFDKSSLAISELTRKGTPAISGLLYCARGSHLQKIWMPRGLPVEDGFLAAMTFTNGFTEPDVRGRIVRADVPFFFEAHKKLFRLLRHQKRIIVGTAINAIIYRYLWSSELDIGQGSGR